MWSAQPLILTVVAIILDDYFKTNPGIKDLPWLGIEPQSPSTQIVVRAMSYNDPKIHLEFTKSQVANKTYIEVTILKGQLVRINFIHIYSFNTDKIL